MYNNRKFNHRYVRLQRIDLVRPLWIDLVVLLIVAGLCAGAGWGALAYLNGMPK